tara:strand:+ start:1044 stop:2177 length:1134 start_codon:yes stop_codon:yes gene_type:complete
MKKKLAIIGSGIAGLTFANFIKKDSNFEFTIYEKEDSLTLEEGFGIQLAPNSVSILNKIGFNKIDSQKIYHPKNLNFYSLNNEKICELDFEQINSNNIKYTTLQRSTLIEFLKDEVYSQHLRFGKRIKKVSEIKDKLLINFEDNSNDLVDYIIAADGIFSNTRTFFESKKNEPIFNNALVVRSILKSRKELLIDDNSINLLMGSRSHIVIYPINKKKELNLVCIIREKKFDPDNIKLTIKNKILNQNPNLKEAFDGELKSWPLYTTRKTLPSSNKKVFYLGDAFHAFLPTMAQGASQSIEAAFELYSLLKEENINVNSLFFQKRLKRVKMIKKRSDFNFFSFHISNPIIRIIRNKILKHLMKSRRFLSYYLGDVYKN